MSATLRHADERQRRRAGFALRPARARRARQPRQARLPLPAAPRGALRRRLEGDGGGRQVLARRAQGEGAPDLFAIAGRGRRRRRRGRRRRAGALRQGAHAATPISSSPACRSSPPRGGRGATSTPRRSRRRSAPAPTGSRRSSRGASSNTSCATTIGPRICRSTSARTISAGCGSNITASGRSRSRRSRPARSTSTRSTPSRVWATGYDFPAFNDGRVKKESLHNGAPTGSQGWYFNTRREPFKDPRVREAIGLAFDFEWTNKNVMFSSYKRGRLLFPEFGDGGGTRRRAACCRCRSPRPRATRTSTPSTRSTSSPSAATARRACRRRSTR